MKIEIADKVLSSVIFGEVFELCGPQQEGPQDQSQEAGGPLRGAHQL